MYMCNILNKMTKINYFLMKFHRRIKEYKFYISIFENKKKRISNQSKKLIFKINEMRFEQDYCMFER